MSSSPSSPSADLLAVLEEAQEAGFLGPGPVANQARHALVFAEALAPPTNAVDLGSGGGVPGLVLASVWPESQWVLVDRGTRRGAFLQRAVRTLGFQDRVGVEVATAEELGRDLGWRGQFDLVVARSFGPPAVTAECGAPFLRPGGWLAVAEPPGEGSRWPSSELLRLGLEPAQRWRDGATVQVLRQTRLCPDRYPRRPGLPAKRPLW